MNTPALDQTRLLIIQNIQYQNLSIIMIIIYINFYLHYFQSAIEW